MAKIDPLDWVATASRRRPQSTGLTDWFPGTVAPARAGLYERHFTDSCDIPIECSLHFWDGSCWLSRDGRPHWRQVGDYPAWRGLTRELHVGQETSLLRGSRGRQEGQGHERRVRAQLVSADPCYVHAVLLEDDPVATIAPFRAGEAGVWHGLSFIG